MTDQERMERSAREAASLRDRDMARIERDADLLRRAAKEAYDARLVRIERDYKAAREAAFLQCERHQDATLNFIATKNDRKRCASLGLDVPFLHPSKQFGRAAAAMCRSRPA